MGTLKFVSGQLPLQQGMSPQLALHLRTSAMAGA